jgi:hypothetical protein
MPSHSTSRRGPACGSGAVRRNHDGHGRDCRHARCRNGPLGPHSQTVRPPRAHGSIAKTRWDLQRRRARTGHSYPELSWATSTGWLFFRAGTQVMAYRPGEPRAVKLPFRLRRDAIGFVAG